MIDPLYKATIKKKLIEEGKLFKEMVVCLSSDEKALLATIGEHGSGSISIFENPTVIVRVNSRRDKGGEN